MIKALVKKEYDIDIDEAVHIGIGAGSDTYFISSRESKYILKFPSKNPINHPILEPPLCSFLRTKNIPVSQFLSNIHGEFISKDGCGRIFHLQKFINGTVYAYNQAPAWLLADSSKRLGQIHTALKNYIGLPEGIGKNFFKYMTKERALLSYKTTLTLARDKKDLEICEDIEKRIKIVSKMPDHSFDLSKLTCQATHGDYFISQLICSDNRINGIIDWTTACIHPVIWELMRSFVYAARCCADGYIDLYSFGTYISNYLGYAALNEYDISMIAKLFFYQISVCDYYNQYYSSNADNRYIYLDQAKLSTKLMIWLDKYTGDLTEYVLELI